MLFIKEIKKSFGSYEVLNIQNFELVPGKYWIKGANGSGKSTFLKIVAGLLPFKGDILIENEISINKNSVAYRSLVNHAPAEPVYPSFVSGQQLVDFYAAIKKPPKRQIETIKEMLNIENYLGTPTGTYSSGMTKKLSLLLAFIGAPKIILLDEPFTTLDTPTQDALQKLIKNTGDTSFIITSHHEITIDEIPFTNIYSIKDKILAIE